MKRLTFDSSGAGLPGGAFPRALAERARVAAEDLFARRCAGSDSLGWLDLPGKTGEAEAVSALAADLRARCDVLVVIGAGGSYLGARSALEFLRSPHYNALPKQTPDILFAGMSLDGDALGDLLRLCEGRRVAVNLVSKSGTTAEPAVAFRSFEALAERDAVVCTCGRGPLEDYAKAKGYRTCAVPDDVGGRYSVLSPVGLLPMAVAGADIGRVLAGAAEALGSYAAPGVTDPVRYAACRHFLSERGRGVELLAVANPHLAAFGAWFQQLFAESEGKQGRGILPVPSVYTADLHSLGQFVQQGSPLLFETLLMTDRGGAETAVSPGGGFDGLSALEGRPLDTLNRLAMQAVTQAHRAGRVPVLRLTAADRSEESYGALVMFFETACAVSALMLGVNPFDQPGVEDYKAHMKQLFGELR